MNRMIRRIGLGLRYVIQGAAFAAGLSGPGQAETVSTSAGPLSITAIATGLTEPWGLDFLPDGEFLLTERDGRLLLFSDGKVKSVTGIPDIWAEGQGGLLDVMVPRDFPRTREIWLTYTATGTGGGATAVGKGRLSEDGTRLDAFTPLWQGSYSTSGRHFGSRVIEAPDGSIFVTTGERGTGPDGMQAQDPTLPEGKTIHLTRDGAPATKLGGALAGVYSLGHRNAQGAAFDADGALWLVEHGAMGGDELNLIRQGTNYGWPVISYGLNYNGAKIGVGQEKTGMEQPVHFWDPSIAPSGLMIYQGDLLRDWRGDMFTGSLNSDFISRLDPQSGFTEERIAAPETARVRDVVQASDGAIWFLSVTHGAVYRMAPER